MKYSELYQMNFNTSLAHTIGNMTTLVLEHYKSQFPSKFFKSFYVDTSMDQKAFIERRKSFLDLKKSKPILSASPKLDTSRPEFATTSYFNLTYGKDMVDGRRNPATVSTLLYDKEAGIGLDFTINRLRINIDIVHTYETIMQQINAFGLINSAVRMEQPYSVTFTEEIQIPNSIITAIRSITNMENAPHKDVLEYINRVSFYPIEYKLKSSTGKMCYFMYIKVSSKIKITTPSLSDGNTEGMTKEDYEISQSCEVEFNYIDSMLLMSSTALNVNDLEEQYAQDIINDVVIVPVMTTDYGLFIPQMSKNGNSFYTATEILLEDQFSSYPDDTNISGLLTVYDIDNIKGIASREGVTFGKCFNSMYEITLHKEDVELTIGKDYEFNGDKLVLTILKPEPFTTYIVTLFRNNTLLNSKLADENTYNGK